jgi:F420H2 dehydrogenase subunit N
VDLTQVAMIPLMLLTGGAFAVFVVARFLPAGNKLLALVTVLFLTAALLALIWPSPGVATGILAGRPGVSSDAGDVNGVADAGAFAIAVIVLVLGLLVAVYSGQYVESDGRGEVYFPLLLLMAGGAVGMVFADDLFQLYLLLELMSIPTYILVTFRRHLNTSVEAGFKYLIMSVVGASFLLLGLSFIYREIGHLSLALIEGSPEMGLWGSAGLACALVGLGIKCAVVPLHAWLPDAHGRAPSSVSALLSGILIQGVFYVMLKVGLIFGVRPESLGTALLALAVLNMTVGNGMALVQTNTKRMLGYSSIAQMGYIMVCIGWGLRYQAPTAVQAGFLLIVAHAAMKSLAFLCKGVFHLHFNATSIEEMRGIGLRQPQIGIPFGVALLGLAGLPPLAGFAGKWLILSEGVQIVDPVSYGVMAILLLNSLLSLGYYLPVLMTTFGRGDITGDGRIQPVVRAWPWMAYPVLVLAGIVLLIGIRPGFWLDSLAGTSAFLFSLGR